MNQPEKVTLQCWKRHHICLSVSHLVIFIREMVVVHVMNGHASIFPMNLIFKLLKFLRLIQFRNTRLDMTWDIILKEGIQVAFLGT